MLASKVEDMINTVVRQIAFYTFERKVHTERRNGELTADQLCELWMSVQAESLGPSIKLGEGYETYWAYIPHFVGIRLSMFMLMRWRLPRELALWRL